MRPLVKVSLVAVGYIGAFAIALAVRTAYIAATSGADRQMYAAMFDFGDDLLFLGVFGVASVVPSATALFFLRPYRRFWRVLSVIAVIAATTAIAALLDARSWRAADARSIAHAWSALASLKILITPLFALGFFVCGVMAPSRIPRLTLLVATAVEVSVFVLWFGSLHRP